ncbi:MAG: TonB-dependent receptor [Acidobacteria bacterium]|nr:TonB-dependent receptor [Acidobacteriota bacterium]
MKLLGFHLLGAIALAQMNRGVVTGIVTDPTGAIVGGARITAVQTETNLTATAVATETGHYTLPSLTIGRYRIDAEASGFKKAVRDEVVITSGVTLRLDIQMELGSLAETVEVRAKPSALETDSSRVGTNITNKLVEDLPLVVNGQIRNVFNLAIIAPETRTANGFRIGGGQGSGWEMEMDGMPLTSASTQYQTERAPISSVSIDAISEFTVETTGMKAEFGRAMGMISFETKSGTNQYHGNLFEFLRNDALDARGFFAQTRPILKQHDLGGTAGGPIHIPKIYNGRDKTFFFFSYESFRNRTGQSPGFFTVPLPAMYEGDFRGWTNAQGNMIPIYDPAATRPNPNGSGFVRDVFPNNQLPKGRFSQVASRYIALRPDGFGPNLAGPRLNLFLQSGAQVQPWDKWSARGDHQLNSKNRLSFLFLRGEWDIDYLNGVPPGLPRPFNGSSVWTRKNTSGRFAWDRTISARVLNSFRVSYQREQGTTTSINSVNPEDRWNEKLKIPNTPGPDRGLPGVTFTEYSGWSGNAWGVDRGRDLNLNNDVTLIRGTHVFKTGFFHARDAWYGGGQHRPNGSFGFSQLATAIPGDQSLASGNAFASFLLGYPSTTGLETPRMVVQRWRYWGGYFQDDWKITPKLTINLGLRYEYTQPIQGGAYTGLADWEDLSGGKLEGFSNFNPTVPNPKAGNLPGALVFSGEGAGRVNPPFDGHPFAIGPRAGLAYQIRRGTVIRAYAGRSFSAVKTTGGSTHFEGLILNVNWSSNDQSINDFPTLLDKGLPPWTKPPFLDPSFSNDISTYFWQRGDAGRPPDYSTWNLDIQQELRSRLVVTIGYTGTKGTHLSSGVLNINQVDPKYIRQYGLNLLRSNITSAAARAAGIPIPYPGFNSTVQRALQPFPQYQSVLTAGGQPSSVGERTGDSTYHAMILKLDKRYSSGLTLLGSYVLSKIISNADTAVISSLGAVDHYNRGLEKSLSGDDQTHLFRLSFSYELPFGKGRRWSLDGARELAFGGWGISGFFGYESGTPYGVGPGLNPIGTSNRPFITSYENWRASSAGGKFDPFKDVWWNRNAFQQGISTERLNSEFGNSTRNNPKTRGPWILNENVSVAKSFGITEKVRATFRWEAFNLLNRVRWSGPNSTITSASFGLVRGQSNVPRQMQLALKVVF